MKIELTEKQLSQLIATQGEVCKDLSEQLDFIVHTDVLERPNNMALHARTRMLNDRLRVLAYNNLKLLNSLAQAES